MGSPVDLDVRLHVKIENLCIKERSVFESRNTVLKLLHEMTHKPRSQIKLYLWN